jgi:hypothetical protein
MKRKNPVLTLILTFVLLITTIPNLIIQPQVSASVNDSTFSIMQISDLQHLPFTAPNLYSDTLSWIVNNSANYNLKMVIDTGDFIDAFGGPPILPAIAPYNDSSKAQEWAIANASMSKLLTANIPYCWCAGNHDQTPWGNSNGTMTGSNYVALNATYMRQKAYWVDDVFGSKNTAVTFTVNSFRFMVINLEYLANSSAIGWMKGLLDKSTGTNVIVATHDYLNISGKYDTSTATVGNWTQTLKTMLDSYSNVFLALSGHNYGWNMTRAGNREEIIFDRQEENNMTGAASVRIYTFNLDSKKVYATTYCLDNKTWLTDSYSQFNFDVSLTSNNPYTDPTALAWNVDASFNFTDMIKANHTYVPTDKVANPVQKLYISYDEKLLTCDIKVGGVTYSLGKDFTYTGHVDYIYYNPSFANPTLGYYYPSVFSSSEATVNYMYNFSAIPGGLEGTLSMLATSKDSVSSIVSVGGTGDFINTQVKATISPQWYEAAKMVVNIYHDGAVSGWPNAVPVFQTSSIAVTYAQLTDYCINVWGLASNPFPTFPANVTADYFIFNEVIGDKFYLGVSSAPRTSAVYDPATKTVTVTYNATSYLGDWYKGVAKMDQGFTGTVVAKFVNYVPGNATATPPKLSTYDIGPAVWNVQGYGTFSGQSIVLRSEGGAQALGKGYAILP